MRGDENVVYAERRDCFRYPAKETKFHPSIKYPEYPFGDQIAEEPNDVYDMVRSCFARMKLDAAHIGAKEWNPLGEIIHEGDTVVLKPNLVMHKHHVNPSLGTDAIITHPAVVRAVADYCVVALKGKGQLVIGDAPLQNCDFAALIQTSGYADLAAFLAGEGAPVVLRDFRLLTSNMAVFGRMRVVSDNAGQNGAAEYSAVDIGKHSMFTGIIEKYQDFRITNYNPAEMKNHHNPEKNEYLIPNLILDADVVINLPKPKTHRKAGITAAQKNLIGINGHKDWLPHHTKGAKNDAGDEYLHKSLLKGIHTALTERSDAASSERKSRRALFWKLLSGLAGKASRVFYEDLYYEGSWYGNDTIWRTICDLNRIFIYADKKGVLRDTPQRRSLIVADMIVLGEGEGPLIPTPKEVGVIAAAWNPRVFDVAVSAIMGMDWEKIPSICEAWDLADFPLTACEARDVLLQSNVPQWQDVFANALRREDTLCCRPSDGWRGHIELR